MELNGKDLLRNTASDIIAILSKSHECIFNMKVLAMELILQTGAQAVANTMAKFPAMAKEAMEAADRGGTRNIAVEIEQALQEAQTSGKDITVCLEGEPLRADEIQDYAIVNMKKCFADAKQVEADFKASFEQVVSEVEAQLDEAEGEVLSCLPEPVTTEHTLEEAQQIASCLVAEINKLSKKQQSLLAQVAAEVLNAEQKAEDAIEAAAACLATEQQAALDKEHALVKEIEKCIADLPRSKSQILREEVKLVAQVK